MRNFLKSSVIISGTELALIAIGIARSKYLAAQLGAEGLGLYSLLSSFFVLISSFCGGWLGVAYVKYVAEYQRKGYFKAIQKIHFFSYTAITVLTLALLGLLFVFKKFVEANFLSPEILDLHYAIFLGVFVITSFKYVHEYYLNATQSFKQTVSARLLTVSIEFILTLILVYFFQLTGFFISLLLSGLAGLIILNMLTNRQVKTQFNFHSIKSPFAFLIFRFGSVNFFLIILGNLSQYLYRILILKNLDVTQLGLFHALSSMITYLAIFNKGTNYSYVPSMGQEMDSRERNESLDRYLRLNICAGAFISAGAILFFREAILLLYTPQFLDLADISHYFIIAQFLTVVVIAFQSIVVGTNRYLIHTVAVIGTNVLWIGVPWLFMSDSGLISIAVGMIAASVWSAGLNFLYLRKTLETKISVAAVINFAMSLLLIGVAVTFKNFSLTIKIGYETLVGVLCIVSLPSEVRESLYRRLRLQPS